MTMSAGRWRSESGDAGFTMTEVIVALSVMSVAMALFGGGLLQIYSTANNGEALSLAAGQAHTAFVRLDRDVRYAYGISAPATVGATRTYVEYTTTTLNGTITCTQLRVDTATGLLQMRNRNTPPNAAPGSGTISSWSALASYLTGTQSITRNAADASDRHYQELVMTLTFRAGSGVTAKSRFASYTFTALNTSVDTVSDSVCSDFGRP
jgi:prepilin-type N-terminal cleavage/methylation domain-containing protein